MAIQMDLLKEYNYMGVDFLNAYWVIENINMVYVDNISKINVQFNCYPNREVYKKIGEEVPHMSFGGSTFSAYNARLYSFVGIFLTSDIFPEGIPNTREAQLAILYPYLKNYLNLLDVVDILE